MLWNGRPPSCSRSHPFTRRQYLRPQGSRPPRFYGLPKIRKEGPPSGPLSAPSASLPKAWPNFWVGCWGSTWEFISIFRSLRAVAEDILVSFDVVSLFTMVHLVQALRLLSPHFGDEILCLFLLVLPSSFFRFDRQFCEQANGMAMVSPLPPN
jgi:hypothetical protein